MLMNASGVTISPEALANEVYIPAKKGSLQIEMLSATRKHDFIAYELNPSLSDLIEEIAAGHPVLVLENYGFEASPIWHFSVIIGYDLNKNQIIKRSGLNRREVQSLSAFEYLWKGSRYWAMLALRPDQIPATASEINFAEAILNLERIGRIKNARIAYETLLSQWPKNLVAQMGVGNTAYQLHDLEGAKQAFIKASLDHPKSAEAFNNLANVLLELGDINEAIQAAENAVSIGGPFLEESKATLKDILEKAKALKKIKSKL
jgi:tetratricopeptide (TPR) repeat protein